LRKENRKGGKMRENCIEWIEGDSRITITTYHRKLINKILAISKENPSEVEIIKQNRDGSICVHVPLSYLKISPKRNVILSEERKQELRETLQRAREEKCGKTQS
jgi:hypothetical protein